MNNRFIISLLACGVFASTTSLLPAQLTEAEEKTHIEQAIQLRTAVMEFIQQQYKELSARMQALLANPNPTITFTYLGFFNDEVTEWGKKIADMKKILSLISWNSKNKETKKMAWDLFHKLHITEQDLDILSQYMRSPNYGVL